MFDLVAFGILGFMVLMMLPVILSEFRRWRTKRSLRARLEIDVDKRGES
jgi:hypothetical protein